MQSILQQLHDAQSFRMVGELRAPNGTQTTFDARLDGHGDCRGTIGKAESLLVGSRVWTRWEDKALHDAITGLNGGPVEPVDPAASEDQDPESAATTLLRGNYMVTDLPAENSYAQGIAPVCQTGQLLAGFGNAGGDVSSRPAVGKNGEHLRALTREAGPVTLRVYVPATGKPIVQRADYIVDGGRSVEARISELGQPVRVRSPENSPAVSADDVLGLLH